MATVTTLLVRGFPYLADAVTLDSDHDIQLPPRVPIGARTHGIIALSLVAVVVYASLFPFHFEHCSYGEAAERIDVGFRSQPILPGDFLANILMFIPLGYFLLGTLRVDRAGGSILATMVALSTAFALSFAVESLQAFFPPRTPCLNDVMAQALGACVGVGVWQCGGRILTVRLRRAWTSGDLRNQVSILLTVYVGMLVAATLLPFDLDVRPHVLGEKVMSGITRAMEFDVAPAGMAAYLWDLCFFAPAGMLAAFVTRRAGCRGEGRRARRLAMAIILLVAVAGLAVRGKRFDAFSLPVQLVGFGIGWFQGRSMRRRWHSGADGVSLGRIALATGLGFAWCAIATTLLQGQPFDFTDNPTLLRNRMVAMNWLPLNDIYGDNYLRLMQKALRESMLFAIGGAALALGARHVLGKAATMPALAMVFLVAFLFEVGQLHRAAVQPSVTAILWQAVAGWLGFVIVRGLLPASRAATPAPIPVATTRAERRPDVVRSLQPA